MTCISFSTRHHRFHIVNCDIHPFFSVAYLLAKLKNLASAVCNL